MFILCKHEPKTNMKKSQMNQILARLEKGKSITPLEALEKFGCFRLSALSANVLIASDPSIGSPIWTAARRMFGVHTPALSQLSKR